jgi:hypothetical protein
MMATADLLYGVSMKDDIKDSVRELEKIAEHKELQEDAVVL